MTYLARDTYPKVRGVRMNECNPWKLKMIRKIVLTAVILGLVLGSLSCGSGTDQQASLSISGKYSHVDHQGEYLELKKDGRFYMWTGVGYSGEWEQDGDEIILSGFSFGMAAKFKIDGNTLSDEYGDN